MHVHGVLRTHPEPHGHTAAMGIYCTHHKTIHLPYSGPSTTFSHLETVCKNRPSGRYALTWTRTSVSIHPTSIMHLPRQSYLTSQKNALNGPQTPQNTKLFHSSQSGHEFTVKAPAGVQPEFQFHYVGTLSLCTLRD